MADLRHMPASEVFAGSVVGTTGLLVGLVAGLPVIALVHSSVDYPLVAAFAWVLCAFGMQLGVSKGREIVRAAGLSHLVDHPGEPPPSSAFLVDTSAVLDRHLLVLGRAGLLSGGIVLPRFVVDEVRTLAESPDPRVVAARSSWARSDGGSSRGAGSMFATARTRFRSSTTPATAPWPSLTGCTYAWPLARRSWHGAPSQKASIQSTSAGCPRSSHLIILQVSTS